MPSYRLFVVTPERVVYDGEAVSLTVKTTEGEVGVLAGHIPYVAALDIGRMKILDNGGNEHLASLAGGILRVERERVTILSDACEWKSEIDIERAKRAEERARSYLETPTELHTREAAEAKLRRAVNRISLKNE